MSFRLFGLDPKENSVSVFEEQLEMKKYLNCPEIFGCGCRYTGVGICTKHSNGEHQEFWKPPVPKKLVQGFSFFCQLRSIFLFIYLTKNTRSLIVGVLCERRRKGREERKKGREALKWKEEEKSEGEGRGRGGKRRREEVGEEKGKESWITGVELVYIFLLN